MSFGVAHFLRSPEQPMRRRTPRSSIGPIRSMGRQAVPLRSNARRLLRCGLRASAVSRRPAQHHVSLVGLDAPSPGPLSPRMALQRFLPSSAAMSLIMSPALRCALIIWSRVTPHRFIQYSTALRSERSSRSLSMKPRLSFNPANAFNPRSARMPQLPCARLVGPRHERDHLQLAHRSALFTLRIRKLPFRFRPKLRRLFCANPRRSDPSAEAPVSGCLNQRDIGNAWGLCAREPFGAQGIGSRLGSRDHPRKRPRLARISNISSGPSGSRIWFSARKASTEDRSTWI